MDFRSSSPGFSDSLPACSKLPKDKIEPELSICITHFSVGDDWEHEEIFTDDDETCYTEEREELAPEIPAPPEIKQVYYDCICI